MIQDAVHALILCISNAGKSCLVRRFTDNEFDTCGFASTVGASYAAKKVQSLSEDINECEFAMPKACGLARSKRAYTVRNSYLHC